MKLSLRQKRYMQEIIINEGSGFKIGCYSFLPNLIVESPSSLVQS